MAKILELGSEAMMFIQMLAMTPGQGFANQDYDREAILNYIDGMITDKNEDERTAADDRMRDFLPFPQIDRSDADECEAIIRWWLGARAIVAHMWALHGQEYGDFPDMINKVRLFLDELAERTDTAYDDKPMPYFDPSKT